MEKANVQTSSFRVTQEWQATDLVRAGMLFTWGVFIAIGQFMVVVKIYEFLTK